MKSIRCRKRISKPSWKKIPKIFNFTKNCARENRTRFPTISKEEVPFIYLIHLVVDRHFGKENLHDFIEKKREMFLVQYALGVKREEMRKLEEIAQVCSFLEEISQNKAEEQKLLDDEKALEEDAAKFDAFLKENDKNSVEAIKKYATIIF